MLMSAEYITGSVPVNEKSGNFFCARWRVVPLTEISALEDSTPGRPDS